MVNTIPLDIAQYANLSPVDYITCVLRSKGALDITHIDLNGKTDIADSMIIASGTSSRHVAGLADYVSEACEQCGIDVLGVEGKDDAEWVIVDNADIIIHLFKPEMREAIALERMWADEHDIEQGNDTSLELVM